MKIFHKLSESTVSGKQTVPEWMSRSPKCHRWGSIDSAMGRCSDSLGIRGGNSISHWIHPNGYSTSKQS